MILIVVNLIFLTKDTYREAKLKFRRKQTYNAEKKRLLDILEQIKEKKKLAIKTYGSDLGIGREQREALILLKCLEEHKKIGEGENEESSDDVSCDEVVDAKVEARNLGNGDSDATDDLFEATQAAKKKPEQKDVGLGSSSLLAPNDESPDEVDEYTRGI